MSELDKLIEATLHEEDRALLNRVGHEPGYVGQMADVFGGPLGGVNVLMMVVQTVLFLAGAWCGWKFFEAEEVLPALRWGLSAAVLLLTCIVLKISTLWSALHANRVLREIKRLELQLARQAGRGDRAV